jgi:hypothetical protein
MSIGTIVGLGESKIRDYNSSYNKKYNLLPNRHSAIVVGYAEDGVPIIYDTLGKYHRIDNREGAFAVSNITIPKEFEGKTFAGLKEQGILSSAYQEPKIKPNKNLSPEMNSFISSILKNQDKLSADLGVTPGQYSNYSDWLYAIAMNETKGGRSPNHKIQTPLGLGSTIGLTQLNIDNILNNPGLKEVAEKYGVTQKSDLKDPAKAAIASMIYAANLDKTSKRNYEIGKPGGERTFRYNPRSAAYNSKGFLAESSDGKTPAKYIPIRSGRSTLISDDKRSIEDIQRDLDEFNPGVYTVKQEGAGGGGQIVITKKTKGYKDNTPLSEAERFFYSWQSPNAVRTGDAQGKSAYVAKANSSLRDLNTNNIPVHKVNSILASIKLIR